MTGAASSPPEGEHIEGDEPRPLVIRRRGRRVSTEPTPGYTGEPPREQQQSTENDAQLRQDVPPHWG
ncbi:hypothetical protein ACVWW9_001647 [Agrococcus sp. UYP33]